MPESFDEAFPGGMEECVSTLGQEPSIDDPEALCGWLKENGFEALRQSGADTILAGLEVEFVSVVDEPAQDSEWLLAKSANADEDEWTPGENRLRTADIVLRKASDEDDDEEDEDEEMKVWAAVLKPGEADAHNDLVPEPEIESAAHTYLKEYRKMDADHDLLDGEGVPIESYIVRGDPDVFETPDGKDREYPPGTWIMGAELSPEAWKRVESGELSGFSIYGGAAKINAAALLTEEQQKALSVAIGKEHVEPDDLVPALQAFADETGEDPEDATLVEFLTWLEENPDYDEEDDDTEQENEDEDDGEESDEEDEEEASKGVSPEVEAQVNELHAVVSKSMGNDDGNDDGNEQNELLDTLGEVRDTVKNTNEKVEKHGDRLDGLRDDLSEVRDDLDETRKEVGLVEEEGDEGGEASSGDGGDPEGDGNEQGGETAKAFEELTEEIRGLRDDLTKSEGDGSDEDVERKTQKNAGVGDDEGGEENEGNVEKSAGDLDVSFGGIASEEAD